MTREIKFRAWDKDKKVIIYDSCQKVGEIYDLPPGSIIHNTVWYIGKHYCTLMQYTGLKDKNGKEIYYDDIYICPSSNMKLVVDELTVAYWIIDDDRMNDPMKMVEVIGNIHQNPGLLKN